MKKIAIVFTLVVAAVMLTGCDFFQSQKAIEYNDKFVNIQNSVIRPMLALGGAFKQSDPAMMQTKLAELKTAADKAVIDAKQIEKMEGDEGIADAAMALFLFYQRISNNDMVRMVAIMSKTEITEADATALEQISMAIDKEETVLDANFISAQQRFAQKHGFPMLENEIQKEIDNF